MNPHFKIIEESNQINQIPQLPVYLCDEMNNYYLLAIYKDDERYEPRKRYHLIDMATGEMSIYSYNESDILSVLEKYKICDAELVIK